MRASRSPTVGRTGQPTPFSLAALAVLVALLTVACGQDEALQAAPEEDEEPLERIENVLAACEDIRSGTGTAAALAVDTVATDLEIPWDLAFLPEGRILLTERGGSIRLIDADGLRAEPWASVEVASVAEAGLLGIDVAPDFAQTGHVYVLSTYLDVPSGALARAVSGLTRRLVGLVNPERAQAWKNQVVRFTDNGSHGTDATVIIDNLPSGPLHAGGALRFGADGFLYIGIGDGNHPGSAAEWSSYRGKILRLDVRGAAATGNPREGSAVFALGFRNPQGFDWDPVSGDFLAIDHGPTGLEQENFRRDKDELNRVVAGGDYGWPTVAGRWHGGGFETALVEWTPAIAPAGMAFVDAPESTWHGDVVVTGLRGRQLRRVVFDRGREGVEGGAAPALCQETLFENTFGRLRGIRSGPDGDLYFTTSNHDQRGVPDPMDDLLVRIRPPAAGTAGN